jgi:hypothetical protein
MKWDEFRSNVEKWAHVRAIYEQSSEVKQQVKALEEIGEYLVAENDEERMDAIGDIAVCIVNAAAFRRYSNLGWYHVPTIHVGKLANELLRGSYNSSLSVLKGLAEKHHYDFMKCCENAWNEIKDRKGMMIDGFYVKWENLTEEQRQEFRERDIGNTLLRRL